ncbi:MAG: ribulose phosphate epimerase [Nannocystaceae bacterium]|nr:ribulose phosphate epimerase [Myxococcales bacterium]
MTGTTAGTNATGTDGTDSGSSDATSDPTTDPTTTTSASDTDCEFVCESDIPTDNQCDIWAQDCPDGEKCMPWANDGGGSWNATKCTAVDPQPGQAGDVCTVEGSAVSGVDSCDEGLLCWFVDGETNEGTCLPMCTGSMDAPMCDPGSVCDISNGGVLILCLQTCDPVIVDCDDGLICFPTSTGDGQFICDFDASGPDFGAYKDPCEFINVCDPGLFCANAESVPGCEAAGCCTPFCDINEPTCPDEGLGVQCVPWYGEGETPPPGLEHVGACVIPA